MIMRTTAGAILLMIALGNVAVAQTAERQAEAKARCVHEAIFAAGAAFDRAPPPRLGRPITPAMQEASGQVLKVFAQAAEAGVKKCLTEVEVFHLGWFSFLEDTVLVEGNNCRLAKGAAFKYGRTANNNDGDLINGAAHWQQIEGEWEKTHPFFRGQSDARQQYRNAGAAERCRAVNVGFGAKGDRFPGLVK